MSIAFKEVAYFSNRIEAMVSNTEISGNYTGVFEQAAKYFEDDAKDKLSKPL